MSTTVKCSTRSVDEPTACARPVELRGWPRKAVPAVDAADGDAQQWHQREAARQALLARVHALHHQGQSLHSIARETGLARQTLRRWLQQAPPPLDRARRPTEPQAVAAALIAPEAGLATRQKIQRMQPLVFGGVTLPGEEMFQFVNRLMDDGTAFFIRYSYRQQKPGLAAINGTGMMQ